jgi:hypothetical protein
MNTRHTASSTASSSSFSPRSFSSTCFTFRNSTSVSGRTVSHMVLRTSFGSIGSSGRSPLQCPDTACSTSRTFMALAFSIHACSVSLVAMRESSRACEKFSSPFWMASLIIGSCGNAFASRNRSSATRCDEYPSSWTM